MPFQYCPRCGTFSFERLKSHGYCIECNYSPDLITRADKEIAGVPLWFLKLNPKLVPYIFDRPRFNGAVA